MTELKPCPFCGGSVHMTTVNNDDLPNKMHYFLCRSCCKKITLWSKSADLNNAEAEAIEAWNTRAERTCTAVLAKSDYASTCSECGAMLANWAMQYCPNCGARVTEVDE